MQFSTTALSLVLGISSAFLLAQSNAFNSSPSFITRTAGVSSVSRGKVCSPGCNCPSCAGTPASGCNGKTSSCDCPDCQGTRAALGRKTCLYSETTGEAEAAVDVPSEIEAMDGVEGSDEAHNVERPARESLKKKRTPKAGKPLSDYTPGETIKATVKSVTSYGAFCDFGAKSDGLLHISRMSNTYVSDVSEVVQVGQELEVRLLSIDADKGQVALTLLTEEEESSAAEASSRPKRQQRQGGRREDTAVLNALSEKGFDSDSFVSGKVVSTVSFGAFVRVDASTLNPDVTGSFDGLVHISALSAGRASSVEEYAKEGQDVQVRIKSIDSGKVSLSMVSAEDEESDQDYGFGEEPADEGAKDWKESLAKIQSTMDKFDNKPIVICRDKL